MWWVTRVCAFPFLEMEGYMSRDMDSLQNQQKTKSSASGSEPCVASVSPAEAKGSGSRLVSSQAWLS